MPARRRVGLVILLATWCYPADAAKTKAKPAPVVIVLKGEGPVRALIAAGIVMPCDSLSNMRIMDAVLSVGYRTTVMSTSSCFCVQQSTRGSTMLGDPHIVCRAGVCESDGTCAAVEIELKG